MSQHSKAEVIAAVKETGGIDTAARKLGVAKTTLRDRIKNKGWQDEVEQARASSTVRPHARRPTHLPSNKEITKAVTATFGNVTDAAKLLKCNRNTLQHHIERTPKLATLVEDLRAETVTKPVAGDQVSREEILEQQVKELQAAHRAVRKSEVFEQRIIDALTDAVQATKVKYSPLVIPKSKLSHEKHEFVLLWSDTHAGEVVTREETNNINEYDWTVMMRRHDKLRESVFSYQDNRPYPVEKLHVFGLGDMLSGNIHDELSETNEVPLAEATIQFGLDGSEFLASLHDRFAEVAFAGIVGNHPRAHRKPRAKQQFDNADWTAYHVMRLALRRYPKITFDIPKAAYWPVEIARNWRALLFHGDGIRSTMPGVPWGGVLRRAAALQNQYTQVGKSIDLFALGHFHTANLVEFPGGRVAMNGSVKGVDEYSVKAFGGGRGPQQLLLTFHPRNGLTDASIIDLEDVSR